MYEYEVFKMYTRGLISSWVMWLTIPVLNSIVTDKILLKRPKRKGISGSIQCIYPEDL